MSTTDAENLEKIIFEFVKNRSNQNESTTSRHVHRRFDISMEDAEQFLVKLLEKNLTQEFYDNEYQENRYTLKE